MFEKQPLVSIIMPVFNSEKYVSEAIESVRNQGHKNWELLIVNDGSTDYTSKIIDDYSKRDSRIKVFNRKNEGVSGARNFALSKICGAYVTFIDSDDVYHTDRLKRMLQVFEKDKECDIVFSRYKEFKGKYSISMNQIPESKAVVTIDNDVLKKIISDSRNHFMCNVMIKSEIAVKEKFAPIRFAEDYIYIRDCVLHCKKATILDEALYFYRRDNENAMTNNSFSEKYILDYMMIVENVYQFCEKNRLEDEFYKKMVAHEYSQNGMRIRKSTSYSKFVACMNDKIFREGIQFADASQCTLFERGLFFLIKHKIYFPFIFWIW